jgi:hypothetical protein
MNVKQWIVAGMVIGALAARAVVLADDAPVGAPPPPVLAPEAPVPPPPAPPAPEPVLVPYSPPPHEGLFPANQLNLDLFGTYATRDRNGNSENRGGGGLGFDYFFTRYFGIGVDSYLEEWKWPYRVNGSAIVRLPLPTPLHGIALYGLGGGGREFYFVPQYTWHGGGGVEWKLSRRFGIFGDVREVLPKETPNYTLVRAGISVGF